MSAMSKHGQPGKKRMFFKSMESKVAEAVLAQVKPFLTDRTKFIPRVPPGLASDKYILGLFCANIGRAGADKLTLAQNGSVVFTVLERLFGDVIDIHEIDRLSIGIPVPNAILQSGAEAARRSCRTASALPPCCRHRAANRLSGDF